MTRQTSIEAYREIESNGLLSRKRWEVYNCLFHHGPLSQQEVCRKLNQSPHIITPRFAELKEREVIREIGHTIDQFSGHKVILWDVTNSLPKKLEKQKPKQIFYGVLSKKFGQTNYLFKTKGAALRYQMQNNAISTILEFEIQ